MGLLRARTYPRRAAWLAALVALLASAVAGVIAPPAGAKKKAPVIKKVSPMDVAVGQQLVLKGRHFIPGRGKNTVVFKRKGERAVFTKADLSTRKLLRVTVPERLTENIAVEAGEPVPTRFKLRVLAQKFGKRYTGRKRSPMISARLAPAPANGDCDSDGQLNSVDGDDDNDMLLDTTESGLPYELNPCKADSDDDGVGDGYEYRSARDLNNDEYQNLNAFAPFPGKKPYPNPLDPTDAGTDFDGDSLTLREEHSLWKLTLRNGAPTPTPQSLGDSAAALTYSDGAKYSIYQQSGDDRRTPALSATGYSKESEFDSWLLSSGYGTVHEPDTGTPRPIRDFNRDTVSTPAGGGYLYSEAHYLDMSSNGWLSDDERDEDADGLSNWDETHGRMTAGWWTSQYPTEAPFRLTYLEPAVEDPDTDRDGVRDGADDQDHDDIPNIVELSRNAHSGRAMNSVSATPPHGRVNPFNPCLPFRNSRTCPTYVPFEGAWAPFDGSADYVVRN